MDSTADFVLDAQGNKYWKEFSFDFGTGTNVVYGTIRMNDAQMQAAIPLKLHGQEMDAAVVAWHNGDFYWGEELLQAVEDNLIPGREVIRCLKLTLYEGFAKQGFSVASDKARDQLAAAGKSVEETVTALFSRMVTEAENVMCGSHFSHILANHGEDFLRSMPIRARITLPHSFGPHAGSILGNAAKAAGVSRLVMASEQMSALAAYMDLFPGETPEWAREPFLLMDCGAGTFDSVKVQYVGDRGTGCKWREIAQSSGSVSGGDKVNQYVQQYLDAKYNLQRLATEMDMLLDDVKYQVLQGFEMGKTVSKQHIHSNKPGDQLFWSIIIKKSAEEQRVLNVTLKMVRDACDKVFDENYPAIDKLIQPDQISKTVNPMYIVLCGGYGQSPYFKRQLEDRYGKHGIKVVALVMSGGAILVAKGALSPHYGFVNTSGLPLRFNYLATQDELFDPRRHKDCTYEQKYSRFAKGTRTMPIERKVRRQVFGAEKNTRTVKDRLRVLCRKGQVAKDTNPIIYVFQPFVDDPRVTMRLLCSELDDIEDGDPALDDDHDVTRDDDKLRDGILPWIQPLWVLDKDVMERGGWITAKDSVTGRPRWQNVYGRATIRYQDERDMEVELELLTPSKGGGPPEHQEVLAFKVGSFKLWNSARSPFLTDDEAGR